MTEHTDGPWAAIRGADKRWQVRYEHGTVCTIEQWTDRIDKADARLIAAAPDMLALLKLALGDSEHVLSQKFWDDVRVVIAQAETSTDDGEQK